jgi:hypothetical protein
MIVIKFSYTDKFDVVAPLKCGTRWLKKYTSPDSIESIKYNELFNKNQIFKEKIFFIYRDVLEHFKSGLYTEYLYFNQISIPKSNTDNSKSKPHTADFDKYKNINELFKKLTTYGGHFTPNFWETFYKKNNINNFKLIHLDNLSSLFKKEILFDKTEFNYSKTNINQPTKQDVYNMLSTNQLDILNKIIEKETKYLNEILSAK